jgi:hypothetical protein
MLRTLGFLDAAELLRAPPPLLHLLARGALDLKQAEARLPVLGLELLHCLDVVVDQPKAR